MNYQSITLRVNPIPAPRMTQKSRFYSPAATRYSQFKTTIFWLVKNNLVPYEKEEKLMVACNFVRYGRSCDGDNMLKAILDALQFAQVIPNDRNVIEAHYFVEYVKNSTDAFIELFIKKIDENKILLRSQSFFSTLKANNNRQDDQESDT